MTTITPDQVDLTEHVFRSLRGWLHQLFPSDHILTETRQDAHLSEDDATDGTTTPGRPLWHQKITAGPTWSEHTRASSKIDLTIELLRNCESNWDAQRSAGRVLANASRPGGRIPLRAYNLVFPQPPQITADATPGTLPAALLVAVAAVGPDGIACTQPSEPLTVAPGSSSVSVTPRNWPAGAGLGYSWHVYAAEPGDALTKQASIPAGGTAVLSALATGTTSPTNLRADMLGIRVNAVDAQPIEVEGAATPTWDMRATLRLTVQVPRVFPAHLDDIITP